MMGEYTIGLLLLTEFTFEQNGNNKWSENCRPIDKIEGKNALNALMNWRIPFKNKKSLEFKLRAVNSDLAIGLLISPSFKRTLTIVAYSSTAKLAEFIKK